ncbi:MAG TPA: class I SAM-dependent methyltransferase [Polyangiaceae bacterium]|jgi:SAM-dependent methyltransferase|nr:class I SAM-dependent methyltransferase [Polyangiaceae bacterium]
MSEPVDYFENHRHKLRFPWSLYHRPIVAALGAALGSSLGPDVLNVGSGPFLELTEVDATERRISVCDIDARAIEAARRLHGDKIVRADVIEPNAPLPYAGDSFDLVVSMDVIEHLPPEGLLPWLQELLRVLKPGGLLFLTTPNYASKGLVMLEQTALELIARRQGFSRKSLHPSKLTPAVLGALLGQSGFTRCDLLPISFGWVLAAHARKPASSSDRQHA